ALHDRLVDPLSFRLRAPQRLACRHQAQVAVAAQDQPVLEVGGVQRLTARQRLARHQRVRDRKLVDGRAAALYAARSGIALALTRIDARRAACAWSARRAGVDVETAVRHACGVDRCDAERRPAVAAGATAVCAASEAERRPGLADAADSADSRDDAVVLIGNGSHGRVYEQQADRCAALLPTDAARPGDVSAGARAADAGHPGEAPEVDLAPQRIAGRAAGREADIAAAVHCGRQ